MNHDANVPAVGPSPAPADDIVNPLFVVSADQVRAAFDDYELKGERKQSVSLGETHSEEVVAQGANKPETLTLSVEFLSPLDQARKLGHAFGLVAKDRTPADRKEYEDRVIGKIVHQSNQVFFTVRLLPVPDSDFVVPQISFTLLSHKGNAMEPTKQPTDYTAPPHDDFVAVSLRVDGQELLFPVFSGSVPKITDKMDAMILVVNVDGMSQNMQYRLKA